MTNARDDDSFLEARRREITQEDGLTVPLSYESLSAAAEDALEKTPYDYVAGGAGRGETMQANREAFREWRIVPRVLRDVSTRSLETELLGETLSAPLLAAPVGRQARFHDAGERASARAARSLDVPFTLSTWSTRSIEDVAERLNGTPGLFQLYWVRDWDVTASLVRRAEQAGYRAIAVTVDSKVPTWRTRNLENGFSISDGGTPANFVTDPVVQERYADDGPLTADDIANEPNLSYDLTVSWEDLSFLRKHTNLPILLKGVLHPDDARRAVEHGVDGVIVSTHGGRQVDGTVGALEALPAVADAVSERAHVLFDSGIRGGADAFKALALGADAVFVGRPYVYGLAVAGERGVYEVFHNYLAELESIVGLTGHSSIDDVDRDVLQAVHG